MNSIGKILAVIGVGAWVLITAIQSFHSGILSVSVLDVGQGDGILIEFPDSTKMLVDGGPGTLILSELGSVLFPWDRRIETIVLTHDHDDHLIGLIAVVQGYQVKRLLYRKDECRSMMCARLVEVCRDYGVSLVDLESVNSGSGVVVGGVILSFFWLNKIGSGDSANDLSVVTVLTFGSFSIMLTGDLEAEGEMQVISSIEENDIENVIALKAGHHCSRTASSSYFLEYFDPDVVLCSIGEDNSFGHPHMEALERFRALEIPVIRTDTGGRIQVWTDGKQWHVEQEE